MLESPRLPWTPDILGTFLHISIFMSKYFSSFSFHGILLAASGKGKGPAVRGVLWGRKELPVLSSSLLPNSTGGNWLHGHLPRALPFLCCRSTEIPFGNAGQLWSCSSPALSWLSQDEPQSLPWEPPGFWRMGRASSGCEVLRG